MNAKRSWLSSGNTPPLCVKSPVRLPVPERRGQVMEAGRFPEVSRLRQDILTHQSLIIIIDGLCNASPGFEAIVPGHVGKEALGVGVLLHQATEQGPELARDLLHRRRKIQHEADVRALDLFDLRLDILKKSSRSVCMVM